MRWLRAVVRVLAALVVLAVSGTAVWAAPTPTGPQAPDVGVVREVAGSTVPLRRGPAASEDEAIRWLRDANLTQAATRSGLRVLGDAQTCAQARYVTYRRSGAEPQIVDQWYLASQLWADAVLLAAPDVARVQALGAGAADRCHLDKGFIFLDRLWDVGTGGYYPRSDLTGTFVDRSIRFTDDNSLAGLALLDAAASVGPGPDRQRYLHAARREAEFLFTSGLWDDTFGGGFWWNTNRGNTGEGKPTQSNALAALFFARMHRETGVDPYRIWSLRVLDWLDAVLYDPSRQLYQWSVSYADPATRTGTVVHQRYFNYDQGIAIEAQLEAARFDDAPARRARARDVGEAVHPAFWGQEHGGYNLEAGIEQVYTSYAAWTSLGHLALYRVDADPRWLDLARDNAEALMVALRRPAGGYAYRHYRCVDTYAPGCESGQVRWVVDYTFDTSAQAWLQHLQAAIGTLLWPAAPPQRELVITISGSPGIVTGPGIACTPDCSESYPSGTSVTLAANPKPGSVFVGWGGACSGTGPCQVTLDAARSVTATFDPAPPISFPVTVTKRGGGVGSVISEPAGINCGTDCSENVAGGSHVVLTAVPAAGADISAFAGWSGACSGMGTCLLAVDAAKTVTATFERVNAGVSVGPLPGAQPSSGRMLGATITARGGCGSIERIRFGEQDRPFDNARIAIASPAGGPVDQTVGFSYRPPPRTTTVAITIQRVMPSGGATVSPIILDDACGEWRTFVGGGPDAFR